MAALSQTIGNLLGGVSQQPDPVKLPGQVREAENVYLDPTFGCSKRPGTQFISKLGDDIPEDAKWIPIFRDDNDRYVACMYPENGQTTVRVWAADSGEERTVDLVGSASDYIAFTDKDKIKALTINDYTILVNGEKTVSMNSDITSEGKQEALVVINQVAYNTRYQIDFLKDGDLQQEKVYKASKLSVTPASFEVSDEGGCALQDVESFVTNTNKGGQGLGFTLTTACTPTLITGSQPGTPYPTAAKLEFNGTGAQFFFGALFGPPDNYTTGSYLYSNMSTTNGSLDVRVEAQSTLVNGQPKWVLVSTQIRGYDETRNWTVGKAGNLESGGIAREVLITSVRTTPSTPTYTYVSKYQTDVNLNNGGVDVRVGHRATVSMAGKNYTVKVEEEAFGFSFSAEASVIYSTAADIESGVLDVNEIVSNLTAAIRALDDYDADPIGNVIYIQRVDDRAFNLQVSGGAADRAMYGLKDAVNDVSQLPQQGKDGVTLKVSNTADSDTDDYYVKFVTEGGIPGQGFWEESIEPGILTNLNNATMPHVLIREDDGNFTLQPLSKEYDEENFWVPREVGDDNSNPVPTFVDKPIRDVFFFMNRLGVLSEDTVILSQAGDYFNFFQGSAIAISDADPIDLAASSTRPSSLKAAIGTPAGLLIFAQNSQFLMSTEDVAFGPSTVKMTEITNYSYDSEVEPVETGVSVLFCTSAATYSKVFELSTDSLQARPLVSENTRIVPEYIPPNLTTLTSVPNSSMILLGNGDNILYTFKFYNTGNERNLAGWTKWIMPTNIQMTAFDHDTGYIVGHNSTGQTILSRMELLDDPETSPIQAFDRKFTPRLDHYLFSEQVTIENQGKRSKVYVPSGFLTEEAKPYLVATFEGSETFFTSGEFSSDVGGDFIMVDTAILDSDFILGLGYTMSITLPSFFVKSGEQNRADRRFPPIIENVYLELYYSGRYEVIIKRKGYIDRSVELGVIDADVYLANDAAIDYFSTKAIPVYSQGDLALLTITAEDPLPAAISSYSWEGHYNTRGIASR